MREDLEVTAVGYFSFPCLSRTRGFLANFCKRCFNKVPPFWCYVSACPFVPGRIWLHWLSCAEEVLLTCPASLTQVKTSNTVSLAQPEWGTAGKREGRDWKREQKLHAVAVTWILGTNLPDLPLSSKYLEAKPPKGKTAFSFQKGGRTAGNWEHILENSILVLFNIWLSRFFKKIFKW